MDSRCVRARRAPRRWMDGYLICVPPHHHQAHYPVTDRSSNTVPPLVAQYHPKRRRSSVAAQVFRRKTEETQEMDTMELDTTVLPMDAMGRFWGTYVRGPRLAPHSCIIPLD